MWNYAKRRKVDDAVLFYGYSHVINGTYQQDDVLQVETGRVSDAEVNEVLLGAVSICLSRSREYMRGSRVDRTDFIFK